MSLSCLILFLLYSLNAETLERAVIFMMTIVIVQIVNQIQMPPSGVGFYSRWVKNRNRIRW